MGAYTFGPPILRKAAAIAGVTMTLVAGTWYTVNKTVGTAAEQEEKVFEYKTSSGSGIHGTGSGTITASGKLILQDTSDAGWTVQAGANAACVETCTHACAFGVNTAATEADIVDCHDATADECLCLGPN